MRILSGKRAERYQYIQHIADKKQICNDGIILTFGAVFDVLDIPMEKNIENIRYKHVQPMVKNGKAVLMTNGTYLFGINEKFSLKIHDGFLKTDKKVFGYIVPLDSWIKRGHSVENKIINWGFEGYDTVLVSYNYSGELLLNIPFAKVMFIEYETLE